MSKKKIKYPNIVRGGTAVPLGNNDYLIVGKTHEQGGVDVGKDLEVEGGEVMHMGDKSVTVYSALPILNGISPAEAIVRGGNPKQVFKAQEEFKRINKLNDDGTKKAKYGRKKFVTGGEEKQFILGKLNNSMYKKPKESWWKFLTEVESPLRQRETYDNLQPKGVENITKRINAGAEWLYRTDWLGENNSENRFFKIDDQIFEDSFAGIEPDLNLKNATVLSYKDIKKILPKRDYIGGTPEEVRLKILEKVPDLKPYVNKKGKEYGIDSNILLHRILKEGWADQLIKQYNIADAINQDNFFVGVMNDPINGFNQLGLDTYHDNAQAGYYNLRREIPYYDETNTNEKGEIVHSGNFNSMYDAIEAKAADLEYRKKIMIDRKIPEKYQKAYLNAMYNLGVNHDDLKDLEWVLKTYGNIPTYYQDSVSNYVKPYLEANQILKIKKELGGKMKKNYTVNINGKPNVRYISSTGEESKMKCGGRKKAELGDNLALAKAIKPIQDIASAQKAVVSNPTPFKITSGTNGTPKNNFWNNIKGSGIVGDLIGLGSNLISSVIGHSTNNKMLNSLEYRPKPVSYTPTKLKTKININPQLDKMRESLANYEETVDQNTISSKAALDRKNRARVNNILNTNTLYADKENQETTLMNQDSLNQQDANYRNTQQYNEYLDGKSDFENNIKELRSENTIGLLDGLNSGAQNLITNQENRKQFKNNMAVMTFANPNQPAEMYFAQGIWSKELYDEYRKMYPIK